MSDAGNHAFDEDALAEAYERALAHEKAGALDAAAEAYREALRIDPTDHVGAAVRLASIGRGEAPPRASEAYVVTLFDQHAEMFDSMLVEQLGYDAPLQLRDLLRSIKPPPYGRVLDLGCGTGLMGEALEDCAAHLTGVDISEEMIAMAHEKELYQELYVAEIVRFLTAKDAPAEERWDLIAATDVLPYLGAVDPLFEAVASRSASGALFAFSTETLPAAAFEGRGYVVGPLQRFAHAEPYLRERLDAAGFETLAMRPIVVRTNEGGPIAGHLAVARRR